MNQSMKNAKFHDNMNFLICALLMLFSILAIIAGHIKAELREDPYYARMIERKYFYSNKEYCERIQDIVDVLIQNFYEGELERLSAERNVITKMVGEYKYNKKLQTAWQEVVDCCIQLEQNPQMLADESAYQQLKIDFEVRMDEFQWQLNRQGKQLNGLQLGMRITIVLMMVIICVKFLKKDKKS